MRGFLVQIWCNDCGHGWGAPKPGPCPECASKNVNVTGRYAVPSRIPGFIAVLVAALAISAFVIYAWVDQPHWAWHVDARR
jgi:hypothetical protein